MAAINSILNHCENISISQRRWNGIDYLVSKISFSKYGKPEICKSYSVHGTKFLENSYSGNFLQINIEFQSISLENLLNQIIETQDILQKIPVIDPKINEELLKKWIK